MVDNLAANAVERERLTGLLREDHPIYAQRGAAAVVRMRGWILLGLARAGLSDNALLFVLEELDAGHDGYLVAAAARALRSYPSPRAAFTQFVMRALGSMRYRDEAVDLEVYGGYATAVTPTTPVRELLATLVWLGPRAHDALPQLKELRATGSGISRALSGDLERAVQSLQGARSGGGTSPDDCCTIPGTLGHVLRWPFGLRTSSDSLESMVFQDQRGATVTYAEFFRGQPSIVVFFYTRCDNPQKCSLTISKLAEVHRQLVDQGAGDRIRTAAITYDPGFDLPARLAAYGKARRLRMDDGHRLLRATNGIEPLRRHFKLGVNFVESLVNRHRIEVYVLDAAGRIAASFERLHWNEREVVDCALQLLQGDDRAEREPRSVSSAARTAAPLTATMAAWGFVFFPKCPVCWASYASVFGIVGIEQIPYSPWMYPLLFSVMLLNLASIWWRSRSTGRMSGFYLASAGALAIIATKADVGLGLSPMLGVGLTLVGSAVSAWSTTGSTTPARSRALNVS